MNLMKYIDKFNKLKVILIAIAVIAVVISVTVFCSKMKGTHVAIEKNENIDITPEQIASIKNIKQWEFLSVYDEEMVDTIRKGFFSDDELTKIYYGTLRLGINLDKAKTDWLHVEDDSIVVATLPPIELLDTHFIDEARTKVIIKTGKWTAADHEALLERAKKQMLRRCLTAENKEKARESSILHFTSMLQAMGFKNVKVETQQ